VTHETFIDKLCLHIFFLKTDILEQFVFLVDMLVHLVIHNSVMLLLSSEILAFTCGRTKAEWVHSRVIEMITSDFIAKASASLYSFTPPTLYDNFFFTFISEAATYTSKHFQSWLASFHILSSLVEGAFFY
jgi:hypothetical protein